MTLHDFLREHSPLTAVQLLPDNRLINVVIGDGALYGVVVEDIPVDAHVTQFSATLEGDTITTDTGLTFDAADYVMLGMETPSE